MEGQGEPPNQRAALPLVAAPDAAPTVPGGRRDYFGRLPDHLLLRILLRLSTEEAAQTSALSQRWRGVWAQLPRLEFYLVESSVPARALAVYGELDIESLTVYSNQMDWQSTASWLSLAAPRLSGMLYFDNNHTVSQETMQSFLHDEDDEAVMQRGSFELPCFKKATAIRMDLGFLGLALPPAGVFDALRVMRLVNFWSRDQFGISDTVLPSLQEFFIRRVRGLTVLTLKSKSLLDIHLSFLPQLQNLDIVSPSLNKLEVTFCFYDVPESMANVAAERLEILRWEVPCVPDTVNLRKMSSIWVLGAPPVSTLWQETICAEFLNCFQAVDNLELDMILGPRMNGRPLLMEDITIRYVQVLWLYLETNGHVFEGRVLQLLTRCSGIRELNLSFQLRDKLQYFCALDCICHDEPTVGDAKAFQMKTLNKLYIVNFHGSPREVCLVEELVLRAPRLQFLTVISKVKDHSLEGIDDIRHLDCKFEIFLDTE